MPSVVLLFRHASPRVRLPRRAEIKLTSGKGLADLTVPLSTLIDAVVKGNKARARGALRLRCTSLGVLCTLKRVVAHVSALDSAWILTPTLCRAVPRVRRGCVSSPFRRRSPPPQVVAFIKGTRSAPECGFSKRLILNLDECGVEYEVLNVLDNTYNPGLREAIKEYSAWPTIPQLYAHGEFLGGADITGEMHERGELKTRLQRGGGGAK